MGKALYRQYRSRSLDEVIGQEHVTSVLKEAIRLGKISHAYLLTGPRGTGKTSVARIIAHEINALPYADEPHLDIIEIDAASNRRIDDIRDLREKVHMAPTSAKYKVYIIDEVHMLTGESFNALLKTLEEPPTHVVFILATTELQKVPATIISRTQRFHFRAATPEVLKSHLKMIASKELIEVDDDALELIAQRGDGSFRDSISLLDQLASLSNHLSAELVETTLGLAPKKLVDDLTAAIIEKNTRHVIDEIQKTDHTGISAVTLSDQLISKLAQLGREQPQLFELVDKLLAVRQSYHPLMKLTAVLVEWSRPPRTSAARSAAVPTATFTAPDPVRKPRVSAKSKETIVPTPLEEPVVAAQAPAGEFDWNKVMAMLKSRHAPLFSVLSRAVMSYDKEIITLTFKYALHRKKLENTLYRSQLAAVIKDTCGILPEIVVAGQTIARPGATPETDAVTAIMGGGEVVNAV